MSSLFLRIVTAVLALGAAGAFGFGAAQLFHQAQQLSATYGGGFVLIVALMTMLVLISIVRMPLTHANVRRRHR
jgi:hypothetical protein